jgi:murein DD-endopeptidase MepM/ murein hydrolase activator NlpD
LGTSERSNAAGTQHAGVDIVARMGATVSAAMNGVVSEVGEDSVRGKYVIIEHSLGLESRYYHLGRTTVLDHALVSGGQTIGGIGATGKSTGPHLHFEVREYGQPVDPHLYGFTEQ